MPHLEDTVPVTNEPGAKENAMSTQAPAPPATPPAEKPRKSRRFKISSYGAVIVWLLVVALFSVLEPDTFATTQNARIILSNEAISAIIALGLVLPLAADQFDLSIAAVMGFAVVVVGSLMVNAGWGPLPASIAVVVMGALIGAVNGLLVVKLQVSSFIATLGMSSVLAAGIYKVSNGQDFVEGIPQSLIKIGQSDLLGIPLPVYYMLAIAAVLYFVLEHTPFGRSLYATGFNAEAARLSGIKTNRLAFLSLVGSATLAALAGVLLVSRIGTAPYDAGAPYLLPAFAAALLGSTQFRPGRFNVLGTLAAIYLLATGVKGLELMYPNNPWIDDLFQGIALILAVSLAVLAPTAARRKRAKRAAQAHQPAPGGAGA
jgi:ribose transport system permease protein